MPDLRAEVIAVLKRAGFTSREATLPTYASGGTFSAIGGSQTGVNIAVEWWERDDFELVALRAAMAAALRLAGFEVREAGYRLYVPPDV